MMPYKHKIQYYETDKMQITHHSNYIRFMEEARTDFLEQIGWNYDRMEKEGIISPVLNITCDYKKATTYPDVITVRVRVLECKGVRLTLGYTMTVDETVVCTGTSTHCFLNRSGKPIRYDKQYPAFYQAMLQLKKEAP